MRQEHCRILATGLLPSGHCLVEVDCAPLAQPARAGQFLMLRHGSGHVDPLRHPVCFSRGGAVGQLLFPVAQEWQRWAASLQPEETLDVLGPLGQPFALRPGVNHLLVLVYDEPVAPALAAVHWAGRQGAMVSLLIAEERWSSLASLLPSAVECELLPAEAPGSLAPYLRWADQVLAVALPERWPRLAGAIAGARMRLTPGFAGVIVPSDFACGVGACGGCHIIAEGRQQAVCSHGPVLDLAGLL